MAKKIVQAQIDNFVPRWYQNDAYERRKRFNVIVWHRRSGKTTYEISKLICSAMELKKPDGRYAYLAPFYGQAKSVAWDILKRQVKNIFNVQIKEGDLKVILPNASTIRLYGADNPDSLRGMYFDGVVLDEVAQMKPSVWGEIIRPAISDRLGWADFIGTPKGINLFSELYYSAIKDNDWYADLKRSSDTRIIPVEELEQMRKEMTEAEYAQEMECDFNVSSADRIIPIELAREASEDTVAIRDYSYAPVILGVDVAWSETGDRSVVYMRQGLFSKILWCGKGIDAFGLATKVNHFAEDYNADAIFIDQGMGEGVYSALRQMKHGSKAQMINFGGESIDPQYKFKTTEMAFTVKEWLLDGGCIEQSEYTNEIIADLTSPEYQTLPNGKKIQESKKHMKDRGIKSCDLFDALKLTFSAPIRKKSPVEIIRGNKPAASRGRNLCGSRRR